MTYKCPDCRTEVPEPTRCKKCAAAYKRQESLRFSVAVDRARRDEEAYQQWYGEDTTR